MLSGCGVDVETFRDQGGVAVCADPTTLPLLLQAPNENDLRGAFIRAFWMSIVNSL